MNAKRTILAIAAIAALPLAANASQPTKVWYILNARDGTCDLAKTQANALRIPISSPASAEAAYRSAGMFQRLDIIRDSNGAIISVDVVTNLKNDMMMSFFATKEACDAAVAGDVADGRMANPGELK